MAQPATAAPAMDDETLDQLILSVRRFVDERLIPLEAHINDEDRILEVIENNFSSSISNGSNQLENAKDGEDTPE